MNGLMKATDASRCRLAAALAVLCAVSCSREDLAPALAAELEPEAATGLSEGIAAGRNIVLIVIDTLRADRLPFYGCEKNTAPFMSELAERGVVFEKTWATSSWTAPATASIFTSLYPNEHGVTMGMMVFRDLEEEEGGGMKLNRIPEDLETIPTFLKGQGYRTYGVVANPNASAEMGFARGFDVFEHVRGRKQKKHAGVVNERVRGFADELRSGGKFFLYLHYLDPHGPYTRHEQWVDASIPVPEKPLMDLEAYDSEIRFTDEHVREIYELLELDENSLVIITSDHGQEFEEHGGTGHSFRLYRELTQVPLVITLSGAEAPTGRVGMDVTNLDILPTLRALLGAPPSEQDQGRSLVDALWTGAPAKRGLFSMRTKYQPEQTWNKRSIVYGRLKLIVSEPEGTFELFDLEADPTEQDNLAEEAPEIAAWLYERLAEQEERSAAWGHSLGEVFQPTAEQAAELEELGYVDGD